MFQTSGGRVRNLSGDAPLATRGIWSAGSTHRIFTTGLDNDAGTRSELRDQREET